MQHMRGIIADRFDYWADLVIRLLLLYDYTAPKLGYLLYARAL